MLKVVVLILSLALCGLVTALPWEPEPKPDQGWLNQHERFVNNSRDNAANINVLFYGDSITAGWGGAGRDVFNEYYAPLGTANYGIGGDRTEHVLWRVFNGEVEGITPKVTVLKIGTNNFGNQNNDIAAGVLASIRALQYKLPNTKILILGILPRNNAGNNARVKAINEQIQTVNNDNSVRYLDLFEVFCKGEDQFETHLYTEDLVHLTTEGYQAWAEAMAPLFNEMMAS